MLNSGGFGVFGVHSLACSLLWLQLLLVVAAVLLEVVRSWDMIDVDLVFVVSEEGAEGRTYGLDSSVTLRSVDKEIKSLVAGISEDVGLGGLSYGLKDLVAGEMI